MRFKNTLYSGTWSGKTGKQFLFLFVYNDSICLFAADNIFLKPDSYQLGLGDFGLCRKKKCPPNEKPVGGEQDHVVSRIFNVITKIIGKYMELCVHNHLFNYHHH